MNFTSPTSPRSWILTTFLCVTWRARRSSRLKRRSSCLVRAGSVVASVRTTLSATGMSTWRVPRLVDRAHAAETEELIDPVAIAEGFPDRQRPGLGRRPRRPRQRGIRRVEGVFALDKGNIVEAEGVIVLDVAHSPIIVIVGEDHRVIATVPGWRRTAPHRRHVASFSPTSPPHEGQIIVRQRRPEQSRPQVGSGVGARPRPTR